MERLENISRFQFLNVIFKRKNFQSYLIWYMNNGILNKAKYRTRFGEVIRDIERFRICTEFMCHGTILEKEIADEVLRAVTSPDSIFTMLIKLQKATRRISKKSLLKYLQCIVLKKYFDENGCHRISLDDSETSRRIVCCSSLNNEQKFPFYCMLQNLAHNVVYCYSITDLTFTHRFQIASICNAGFVVNHLWNRASEDDRRTLLNESKETIALQLASVIGVGDILRWFVEREVPVNCSEPKKHNSLLHFAARAGNVEVMDMLIGKGANTNALNSSGETPIHAAAAGGCIDAVELLLNNDAVFEPQCKGGNTPLHIAVDKGNVKLVCFLLENEANVNAKNKQNSSPLHIAAIRGNVAIVNLLIAKDADKYALDSFKETPLQKACFKDRSCVIEVLLEVWDPELDPHKIPNRTTELHIAATRGYFKSASVLLQHNADPNAKDTKGKTPLHYAARYGFYAVAALLLNNNANVFSEDGTRKIPIHEACAKGHQAIVKLLLSTQSNTSQLINFRDNKGLTPLHHACRFGQKCLVEYLLNCSGILYSCDEHKRTILHEAAWNGHEEIVKLILEKHPNKVDIIDRLDYKGATAVQLAINFNHSSIINLLASHGATISAMRKTLQDSRHERSVAGKTKCRPNLDINVKSSRSDQCDSMEVKEKIDINAKNESGESQLHVAVIKRDVKAVKSILKKKGLKVNLKDNKMATALHLAVKINCPEIVDLLMTFKNVDLNAIDKAGNTPLHCAVLGQDVATLFLLFRGDVIKKVKINPRNNDKETPLHLAAKSGNVEILRKLLKRSVDFDAESSTGQTALQMAVELGHLEIVQCLIENWDNADICNKNGETILHLAIRKKKEELTMWILENYPEQVNSQNFNGNSGLHFAVMSKNLAILRAVLGTQGVNLKLRNSSQETPLHLLAKHWTKMHEDIIKCLLEHPGIDVHATLPNGRNTLHLFSGKADANGDFMNFNESVRLASKYAVKYGIIKTKLISSEVANVPDNDGNTTLHLSALTGNVELLKFLLDCNGIGINLHNNAGETALHLACREGYFEFVEMILKHENIKIDEEMKDHPWTPLALALNGKHWEIVRLLLLKGAKVNIEIDSCGRSPLHFLTSENNSSLVEVLLERCDLSGNDDVKWLNICAVDGSGHTALDYARDFQYFGIERLIIGKMNGN